MSGAITSPTVGSPSGSVQLSWRARGQIDAHPAMLAQGPSGASARQE